MWNSASFLCNWNENKFSKGSKNAIPSIDHYLTHAVAQSSLLGTLFFILYGKKGICDSKQESVGIFWFKTLFMLVKCMAEKNLNSIHLTSALEVSTFCFLFFVDFPFITLMSTAVLHTLFAHRWKVTLISPMPSLAPHSFSFRVSHTHAFHQKVNKSNGNNIK